MIRKMGQKEQYFEVAVNRYENRNDSKHDKYLSKTIDIPHMFVHVFQVNDKSFT